jgi:hypothetical protein
LGTRSLRQLARLRPSSIESGLGWPRARIYAIFENARVASSRPTQGQEVSLLIELAAVRLVAFTPEAHVYVAS